MASDNSALISNVLKLNLRLSSKMVRISLSACSELSPLRILDSERILRVQVRKGYNDQHSKHIQHARCQAAKWISCFFALLNFG